MNIAFHSTGIAVISFTYLNDIEKTFRTFICSTSEWIDVTDNTHWASVMALREVVSVESET